MNISRTSQIARVAATGNAPQSPATRAPRERWLVGDEVFESTSDMLASGISLDGKPASYQYAEAGRYDTLDSKQKWGGAWTGVATAGGIGLGLSTIISGIAWSDLHYPGAVAAATKLTLGCLAGTAAFAGVAGLLCYGGFPDTQVHTVKGVLKSDGEHTTFTRRSPEATADLNQHSQSVVPEVGFFGGRNYGEQWWNKREYIN